MVIIFFKHFINIKSVKFPGTYFPHMFRLLQYFVLGSNATWNVSSTLFYGAQINHQLYKEIFDYKNILTDT